MLLINRKAASVDSRYSLLLREIDGQFKQERNDNLVSIYSDGKLICVVNLLEKYVVKPKGRTKHYYNDSVLDAIVKCTTPIENWKLVYYVGQREFEVVVKRASYVYCTVVKSEKLASGNFRMGLLKIVPVK